MTRWTTTPNGIPWALMAAPMAWASATPVLLVLEDEPRAD